MFYGKINDASVIALNKLGYKNNNAVVNTFILIYFHF